MQILPEKMYTCVTICLHLSNGKWYYSITSWEGCMKNSPPCNSHPWCRISETELREGWERAREKRRVGGRRHYKGRVLGFDEDKDINTGWKSDRYMRERPRRGCWKRMDIFSLLRVYEYKTLLRHVTSGETLVDTRKVTTFLRCERYERRYRPRIRRCIVGAAKSTKRVKHTRDEIDEDGDTRRGVTPSGLNEEGSNRRLGGTERERERDGETIALLSWTRREDIADAVNRIRTEVPPKQGRRYRRYDGEDRDRSIAGALPPTRTRLEGDERRLKGEEEGREMGWPRLASSRHH